MISLSLYHHSPTWRIIFGAYVLSYLEDGPPISHGEAGEENNPRSWGLTITMGLLTTWDDPFKYRTPPQNVPNLSFRGKAGLMEGKGFTSALHKAAKEFHDVPRPFVFGV